jgi:hypothetical protein
MNQTIEDAALGEFDALVRSGEEGERSPLERAIFLEDVFGICLRDEEITEDNLRDSAAMRRFVSAKARP